jgi:hypothetical protein
MVCIETNQNLTPRVRRRPERHRCLGREPLLRVFSWLVDGYD